MTRAELNALGAVILVRGLRAHHDTDGSVAGRHTLAWARLPDGHVYRTRRHGRYTQARAESSPWGLVGRDGRLLTEVQS